MSLLHTEFTVQTKWTSPEFPDIQLPSCKYWIVEISDKYRTSSQSPKLELPGSKKNKCLGKSRHLVVFWMSLLLFKKILLLCFFNTPFKSFLPVHRLYLSLDNYSIIHMANIMYPGQVHSDPGNSEGGSDFELARLECDSSFWESAFLFLLTGEGMSYRQCWFSMEGGSWMKTHDWKYFGCHSTNTCQKMVFHRIGRGSAMHFHFIPWEI